MKHLVIAEKPSVARDIARVLRCNKEDKLLYRRKMIYRYLGAGTSRHPGRSPNNMASSIKPGTWTHSP